MIAFMHDKIIIFIPPGTHMDITALNGDSTNIHIEKAVIRRLIYLIQHIDKHKIAGLGKFPELISHPDIKHVIRTVPRQRFRLFRIKCQRSRADDIDPLAAMRNL